MLAVALLGAVALAHAGRPCTDNAPTVDALQKGLRLALKTRDALEASGAQIALVARVGQDLSRYGLRYSHVGLAWRDHPAGRWFVVHELNACGTAASDLFDEGLGNFFLDDLFAYEVLVAIPSPGLQARLAALLDKSAVFRFHGPRYNMVAYAFSTRYQNSNQWVLEVLGAALAPPGAIGSRSDAHAWLKQADFAPITLNIGTLERLGGRMFRANIAFDDHPGERRFANQIDTVTVESVIRFLDKVDPGTKRHVIALDR